jgi:superoxide dismutase, Cu-Zn family
MTIHRTGRGRWLTGSAGAMMVGAIAWAAPLANWSATLAGLEGRKVTGTATAKPAADGAGTDVTVTLDGDTPGATRPWHIHAGTCTKSGGVVGGGRAYTPLAIDSKGHGAGKATLAVALADTGSYYVNIHDASSAMGIIVACGDLIRR